MVAIVNKFIANEKEGRNLGIMSAVWTSKGRIFGERRSIFQGCLFLFVRRLFFYYPSSCRHPIPHVPFITCSGVLP